MRTHLQEPEAELVALVGDKVDLYPRSVALLDQAFPGLNGIWDKKDRWLVAWETFASDKKMIIGLNDGLFRFKEATVYVYDTVNSSYIEYPLTVSD